MTQPPKLALEIVLEWLGNARTPTAMYTLSRDEHEDNLHSITRLLATCGGLQSAPARRYVAASWTALLGYYEHCLRTAIVNEVSDADWTLSELARTQRLRRIGPCDAYPSFCKAISAYPTEEAQVFYAGGGVKGARCLIECQAAISLRKRGHFQDRDPRLAAHLESEMTREDLTLAALRCCPGIRPHGGVFNAIYVDRTVYLTVWPCSFPEMYKEMLQDARELPPRVFHPGTPDHIAPRLFIWPLLPDIREHTRARRQETEE